MPQKVFVSGCFDLVHSGHVAFLEEAATYGDLYVALGSDRTVLEIKGRTPVYTEAERLYMIRSLSAVKKAFISSGSGMLDFEKEFREIRPDLLIVNEDGNLLEKRQLCEETGVEYKVLQRLPRADLPCRSSNSIRSNCTIPFRIDIAGGWLDQPFVSKYFPGPVITVSIEPTVDFNDRSGMASSTRRTAIDLWGTQLPVDDLEKLGKILFYCDNPPGKQYVSGSQDAIGIVFPGLNLSTYAGEYWPARIESVHTEEVLKFIENSLFLVPLGPRVPGYSVLDQTDIDREKAKALSDAAQACWTGILNRDIRCFGESFKDAFHAQVAMFPNMMNIHVQELIDVYRDQALGWKLSGAGGGGYLILVADHPIEDTIRVFIRRKNP